MGLAAMTLGSKSVPNVQYHNSSGTLLSGNTDGNTQTVNAAAFSGTNLPYVKDGVNYEIVKNSMTFTGSGKDGWTYTATVSAGNYVSQTIQSKRTFIKKGWLFDYLNSTYSLLITQTGSYKLEVWGAQGTYVTSQSTYPAGLGGYSYGNASLTANNYIYVCTGNKGHEYGLYAGHPSAWTSHTTTNFEQWRPWNGGGFGHSCGGGATHMASSLRGDGQLANYASYTGEVYIVAGGGGGNENSKASDGGQGGHGGGSSGGNGTGIANVTMSNAQNGKGGTSSAGGAGGTAYTGGYAGGAGTFGKGGNSATTTQYERGAGGGGGWYGGGGSFTYAGCGGGGSGYIGGVTGGSMTSGVRSGNGYARITTNFEWAF